MWKHFGWAEMGTGAYAAAQRRSEAMRTATRREESEAATLWALYRIAAARQLQGDDARAQALLEDVVRRRRARGNAMELLTTLLQLTEVTHGQGNLARAAGLARECLPMMR